jgi:hypothetical protein
LIVLEIRKRTTLFKPRGFPLDPRNAVVLDFKFFEKTSFASNTSGSPRSGEAHDWYALGSDDAAGYDLGSSFRPPLFAQRRLFRRDRMCFLFTMSICVGGQAAQNPSGHPSLKAAETGSFEDAPFRRALALTKTDASSN